MLLRVLVIVLGRYLVYVHLTSKQISFFHIHYQMIQEWIRYYFFLNTLRLMKQVYFHDLAVFYLTLVNKLLDLNMIINVKLRHSILIELHQYYLYKLVSL